MSGGVYLWHETPPSEPKARDLDDANGIADAAWGGAGEGPPTGRALHATTPSEPEARNLDSHA